MLPYSWADMKEEMAREAKKLRDIPTLGERAARESEEFLRQGEPEDENVLFQMAQATKKGGGIIITVPQHRFLWSYIDTFSYHKRRYTRKELVEKVERAGFKIIYATSFVSFLFPLMLVARLKQRRSKGHFDPLAEFRVSHFLNSALEKVMGAERAAIQMGFSFPIGGSLLLAGERNRR